MRSVRTTRSRAALGLALPTLLAAGVATAPAAAADAGISIVGGDSSAKVVCGNAAAAKQLAAARHVPLQRNNCAANASGGDVSLSDVDIYISAAARTASPDNAALAALAEGSALGARTAVDVCRPVLQRSAPGGAAGRAVQRNVCSTRADAGRAHTDDTVVGVVEHADGTTTRRTFSAAGLPTLDGSATARCTNLDARLLSQADTCTSTGTGGSLQLRGVTVVDHRAGTATTRRNIDVTVRGGRATSELYCYNVVDGSGKVVQINICRGRAAGGDITLRNVSVHVTG